MLNLKRLCFLSLTIVIIASFGSAVSAQSQSEEFSDTDGVAMISENIWIFPQSQVGNSLYFEKRKIISRADLRLIDGLESLGGFVYLGIDVNDEPYMGFIGDSGAKFYPLEGGFYYLVSKDRNKRRYYWAPANNKIASLGRYNTAAGLVYNGVDKAAFYHIVKGETIEQDDGTLKYQYTFRLHIADQTKYQVTFLPELITDFYRSLKLEWINTNELMYTLSSGETGIIEI